MKTRSDLGRLIQKKREAAGVTQKDVSTRLGFSSPQFVSNAERGRCLVPTKLLRKWASAIKMDPKELFQAQLRVLNSEMTENFKAGR